MNNLSFKNWLCFWLMLFIAAAGAHSYAGDLEGKLDDYVRGYADKGLFNGVVLVAHEDRILLYQGYGMANLEWQIPNAPDTRFRLGSVTKQFTAALILKLSESGTIDLQAPISRYIPDYPGKDGERITIEQLLNHTSGIPNYTSLPNFGAEMSRNPYRPSEIVDKVCALPLEFEPGSRYAYSNSGYFLLGYLIEEVTGKTYERALKDLLLEPLGLKDTGYDHFQEILPRRASGYSRSVSGLENTAYLDTSLPYAAGSLYSSGADLLKWTRALAAGKPFADPATYQRMITPGKGDYGYGLYNREIEVGGRKLRQISHGGSINGFKTDLRHLEQDDYVLIALDNTEGRQLFNMLDGLTALLYGAEPPIAKRPISREIYQAIDQMGLSAAIAHYRKLRADQTDQYDFAGPELNNLGYALLREDRDEAALAVFALNIEMYPEAANPYDSYGEALAKVGRTAEAIANYRKSLELNPQNRNAVERLNQLGVEISPASDPLPQ